MGQVADIVFVDTPLGRVRGARAKGACRFRGIPFAKAPVADLRWRPPRPVAPWGKTFNAVEAGPIAPQLRSRLVGCMGEFVRAQSEDCLRIDIVTPAADDARRPVVVWLHGGGFSSGAGSLDWYDGSRLAVEGDIVVVGVNYRLGALGYLYAPDVSDGNLGLLDQALALRFLHDMISPFGGDPDNITLMGQSAGGNSIAALFAGGHIGSGVRRAIMQSAALGMPPQEVGYAQQIGADFLSELNVDRNGTEAARAALAGLSVEAILGAQATIARRYARFGDTAPPFQLVQPAAGLPCEGPFDQAATDAMDAVDLLIGVTADEAEAFFALDTRAKALDGEETDRLVGALYGADRLDWLELMRRKDPNMPPARQLSEVVSRHVFTAPALAFADRVRASGGRAYFYEFAWHPAESPFGACHCLELPFVFGLSSAWGQAPMLNRGNMAEVNALSALMRASWLNFVRSGDPGTAGLPDWPAFADGRPRAVRFDHHVTMFDPEMEQC